ncbi:ashwin [Anolis carolinensis]|uniref:Ashwin n=1 Tax=Anolis carolinensis TaxID=28377 RepID=A0A803TVW2_ANOCA|nr:PREDICTED: ashwin [Anolis carolinensis]|eukprot:XP_003218816.1 PREDICTED: ashwin [Anolis carolinensis]
MAALGSRGCCGGEGDARGGSDLLLLHPELLSQEFLLLTLEQRNVPVENELKVSKDSLTDLYVQHVIPLPQRELPKTRWGKRMEKQRGQQVTKHDMKSFAAVENLRKRPLIVFDGSSTSTSIKVRKTENGTVDGLKLTAGSASAPCRRLSVSSDSLACASVSTDSSDFKIGTSINESKQNNIRINNNMASSQKSPPSLPVIGTTVVKLKRAAPKEEIDASNGLKPSDSKKKIQHVTWP